MNQVTSHEFKILRQLLREKVKQELYLQVNEELVMILMRTLIQFTLSS